MTGIRSEIKGYLYRAPENSSRHYMEEWTAEAASHGKNKDYRVLDAGAGQALYRALFDHVTYETADFGEVDKEYGHIDHVCDLAKMPMPDGHYDMVLSTQTLEHVPDPSAVLREFHRVLKPDGQAWLSAPLFYEEHEQPYDYHRYTQFEWRRLANETGFEVKELAWLEGYYGTMSYQLHMAAGALPKRWLPVRVVMLALSRRLARADIQTKLTDRGMCKNYRAVFVKV